MKTTEADVATGKLCVLALDMKRRPWNGVTWSRAADGQIQLAPLPIRCSDAIELLQQTSD